LYRIVQRPFFDELFAGKARHSLPSGSQGPISIRRLLFGEAKSVADTSFTYPILYHIIQAPVNWKNLCIEQIGTFS
jgi:hypothetical protein